MDDRAGSGLPSFPATNPRPLASNGVVSTVRNGSSTAPPIADRRGSQVGLLRRRDNAIIPTPNRNGPAAKRNRCLTG